MITAEFTNEISTVQTDSLYQWDTNQTLKISGIDFGSSSVQVHFCNKKSDVALVVPSSLPSNLAIDVTIPNGLLKEPYDILAYVYQRVGVSANTIKAVKIPIIPRPKPNDYNEPSGEEIIEIERMEYEAKAILDGLTASEYSSTTAYKRPNIVYYGGSAYMCLSAEPIINVLPTVTTQWQKICENVLISNVAINADGKLEFTMSDGTVFTSVIDTVEADLVESNMLSGRYKSLDNLFGVEGFVSGETYRKTFTKEQIAEYFPNTFCLIFCYWGDAFHDNSSADIYYPSYYLDGGVSGTMYIKIKDQMMTVNITHNGEVYFTMPELSTAGIYIHIAIVPIY